MERRRKRRYNEDKRVFVVKMTLPASWAAKPCAKLVKQYVKKFNEAHGSDPVSAADCRLMVDKEQSFIEMSATVGGGARKGLPRRASGSRLAQERTNSVATRPSERSRLLVRRRIWLLTCLPPPQIGASISAGDELTVCLRPEHSVHPADVAEAELQARLADEEGG